MYVLWAMHIFQFIFNHTLYVHKHEAVAAIDDVLKRKTATEKA